MKFNKRISKGTRFNQVYIPKTMEQEFEVGDLVQVKLLKKHSVLYPTPGLILSEFKKGLIRDIFSFLNRFKEIKHVFMVGSFLTEKTDYNDIDIIMILNKEIDIEPKIKERFDLKLHMLTLKQEKFNNLLKICPLTRSMFSNFVCNHDIKLDTEKKIAKNHIRFLLMMPEDLLEINADSRAFYDTIRRLITIEHFLEDKTLGSEEINKEFRKLVGERLFNRIKNNNDIDSQIIKRLRLMIKKRIIKIRKVI